MPPYVSIHSMDKHSDYYIRFIKIQRIKYVHDPSYSHFWLDHKICTNKTVVSFKWCAMCEIDREPVELVLKLCEIFLQQPINPGDHVTMLNTIASVSTLLIFSLAKVSTCSHSIQLDIWIASVNIQPNRTVSLTKFGICESVTAVSRI